MSIALSVILWVIIIHAIEIVAIILFLLIRKNRILEEKYKETVDRVNAVDIITSEIRNSIEKIDETFYTESDPNMVNLISQLKDLGEALNRVS